MFRVHDGILVRIEIYIGGELALKSEYFHCLVRVRSINGGHSQSYVAVGAVRKASETLDHIINNLAARLLTS